MSCFLVFSRKWLIVLKVRTLMTRIEQMTTDMRCNHSVLICSISVIRVPLIGLPRFVIVSIFYFQGLFGQHQRPERVDHYRQFVCFGLADAFLHRARVRAVGDAAGVEGYLS